MKIGRLTAGFAALLIGVGTIRASSISTLPYFLHSQGRFSSTAALFGQAFVATPDSSVLTSFTFEVDNALDHPLSYTAYVFQANVVPLIQDTQLFLVGQALFTSSVSAIPISLPTDAFKAVTILTGDLSLQPGQTYFAFIDAGTLSLDDSQKLAFGFVGNAGTPLYYADGTAYYGNFSPGDPSGSFLFGFGEDAAFDLEFAGGSNSDAPEPGELRLVMAGGMLFFLLVFFRRSHHSRHASAASCPARNRRAGV